jgi:hypothetical protein
VVPKAWIGKEAVVILKESRTKGKKLNCSNPMHSLYSFSYSQIKCPSEYSKIYPTKTPRRISTLSNWYEST